MTSAQLQVEQWSIDRLIPYARNSRTHSDQQIAQVAASIQEFGWTNPVLVGADGVIIAGHARLLAARKLKMTEVPVIVLGHLTEAQRRALVLADNQIAINAGWNAEMLRVELQDLDVGGFNLELLGFSAEEVELILAGPEATNEGLTDDDLVPEAQATAITAPGDVWVLGDHRLLCGDATLMSDVEKVLAGGRADMVFCDPPYNVNYGATMKDKLRGTNRPIANDNLGADFEAFLRDACGNMLACCDGAIYVCMSSSEIHTLQRVFREAGGHWSTFVVWAKNTFTMGRSDYQRQYEPILYGWREGADHFWCGARDQGDVWFIKKPHVNDLHPTMKPVELVERAVRNSSKPGDVVLDPFAGSGTTLIACHKAGRWACVMELEPRYCDVIVRRWEAFTGGQARREGVIS
jgi:DNA modification methylase